MKFYINNKKYELDDKKMNNSFVASGFEADVYKFNNLVFKIYKEICLKYRLNEKTAKYLSDIPTKRILLPKDIIYNENYEFYGYTMKYITPTLKDEISNMSVDKLLSELLIIKKDLLLLKDNNVFIDDLCDSNFIFNKGIYFIDPGSYEINKKRSKEYVEIINREIMNDFIVRYILFRKHEITKEERKKINEYFPLNEYMDEIMKKDSSKKLYIKDYSKRIIN